MIKSNDYSQSYQYLKESFENLQFGCMWHTVCHIQYDTKLINLLKFSRRDAVKVESLEKHGFAEVVQVHLVAQQSLL